MCHNTELRSQIKFEIEKVNGFLPADLSAALVLARTNLNGLRERVTQLQAEKSQQRDVTSQVCQQHVRFIQDRKDKEEEVQSETPSQIQPTKDFHSTCVLGWTVT